MSDSTDNIEKIAAGLSEVEGRALVVRHLRQQMHKSMAQAKTSGSKELSRANEIAAAVCRRMAKEIERGNHLLKQEAGDEQA